MNSEKEKWASVGVLRASRIVDKRERELSKDLAAYKRLRREGLQPPSTEGCARLESEAITPAEIATGQARKDWAPAERRRMAALMLEAMKPNE